MSQIWSDLPLGMLPSNFKYLIFPTLDLIFLVLSRRIYEFLCLFYYRIDIDCNQSNTCRVHMATTFTGSSHIIGSTTHHINGIWKRTSTATIDRLHISKSRWNINYWKTTADSKVSSQCRLSSTIASTLFITWTTFIVHVRSTKSNYAECEAVTIAIANVYY